VPPAELFHGQRPTDSGSLLVGEKAILYSPNDYGASYVFLGKESYFLSADHELMPTRKDQPPPDLRNFRQ